MKRWKYLVVEDVLNQNSINWKDAARSILLKQKYFWRRKKTSRIVSFKLYFFLPFALTALHYNFCESMTEALAKLNLGKTIAWRKHKSSFYRPYLLWSPCRQRWRRWGSPWEGWYIQWFWGQTQWWSHSPCSYDPHGQDSEYIQISRGCPSQWTACCTATEMYWNKRFVS